MGSCYDDAPLDPMIRSRRIDNGNGLQMHLLEAGFESPGRPALLLLHGFPELAYSWRAVMPLLAAAGYHAIAPDQRGYGQTLGWDPRYDGDLASFRLPNLARDAQGLLRSLGVPHFGVVGHDFGSPVAAWLAVLAPEACRSVVLMSAPFPGAPSGVADPDPALARLEPPRKHYQRFYTTRGAEQDMLGAAQGFGEFLRAYYYCKSADWPHNAPHPLIGSSAAALAQLPRYYIMDRAQGMAETARGMAPSAAEAAACAWLNAAELALYEREFRRTGLQGGLNWYRNSFDVDAVAELASLPRSTITQPACFIAGAQDWGSFQSPGALEAMAREGCAQFQGSHFVAGAGHWVQQEQPARTAQLLLDHFRAFPP